MRRIKMLLTILAFAGLLGSLATADERKGQLVNLIEVNYRSPLQARVVDQFVEIEFSDAAWSHALNPDNKADRTMANLGTALVGLAYNMGWGDLATLDGNTGGTGSSPPVKKMLESWNGKMSLKVIVNSSDPDAILKAFEKLTMVGPVFTNDYYFHPKGGRALLTVTLSEEATETDMKVSADGNEYHLIVPVYAFFSQSGAQKKAAIGRAPR